MAYALTLTLGAIMWMKALQYQWYSTMYGVYYFAGSVWVALAAAYVIAMALDRQGLLHEAMGAPQAAMAVHAAHTVMQQDVRGAGRAGTAVRADDAVGGERDFHLLRLEPFIEKFRSALRENLDQSDDLSLRKAPQAAHQFQILDEIADSRRAGSSEEW